MRLDMDAGGERTNAAIEWVERFDASRAVARGQAYRAAKRVMDVLIALLGMPIFLALALLCAAALKLESPGSPVLFIQERTGRGGKRFGMCKFRTMIPNAEEIKPQLANLNERRPPDFKITDDPRVTPVGHILRKTSLDELPQIINVLKGEMSLVGPRPTSFSPRSYELWQTERLEVLPGITGLWQVFGRGGTEFDERFRMDIAYMERKCLWLDLEILIRTLTTVLKQEGAA